MHFLKQFVKVNSLERRKGCASYLDHESPNITTLSSIRWCNRSHRDRMILIILVVIRDIPLQRIHAFLCLIPLCIKQRRVLTIFSLHQKEMAIPDKLGGYLIGRWIRGKPDLGVCRIGTGDEQLLVGKRARAASFTTRVGLICWTTN